MDFFAARSKTSGDERSMVVEHMVIHPNFTDYKDDLGNILQTAYSGSYSHPKKLNQPLPALLKLPRPAPSSLAPLCLPPTTTDDLLGLRYFLELIDFFSFDYSILDKRTDVAKDIDF